MQKLASILFVLTVGACASSPDTASTKMMGQAVYRDASTDHSGAPQAAATPPAQTVQVTVTVKGTGTTPMIDPRCATDPAGVFDASYAGTAQISDGSTYVATLASGGGTIATPSGCTISNLTVGAITDVVVRGELSITTENCQSYCAASARADAEAQCGATADAASCRTSAETTAAAQCQTTCTQQAHAIVAEVSLGASALGEVTADQLQTAALGSLSANLSFDHMEDANGNKL